MKKILIKKIELFTLITILFVFLSGCISLEKNMNIEYTFEWSDGICSNNNDCKAIEFGCGGGHIECTSNEEEWINKASTCEVVMNHPSTKGFKCGCYNGSCAWIKEV